MKRQLVPRFTAPQRLIHWTVGISFCALLLSGLALAYPSAFWLSVIFGGPALMRILHPWIGVVYTVAIAGMFIVWAREMTLDDSDRAWLRKVPQYARHELDEVPDAGKFNGGQKLYFWFSIGLAVAFLVTGIPMWFPESFGPGLLGAMRMLHFLATIGGGLLLLMHVYLSTIAFPGTARGMVYGGVRRRWARLHHPAWLREQTEPAPPPRPARIRAGE